MRTFFAVVLILGLVSLAVASDLGNRVPPKSDDHVLQNPVEGDRQGGDTIADAYMIPGFPFTDTGATCGYADDYDEVCPYSGSTSPDVVYSFALAEELSVDIDLCGSLYDTKVYVYDEDLNLVACNDDYYFDDECGVYVSAIFNILAGPGLYYIVVDGYGGDCGTYLIDVAAEPYEPCVVECPAGAVLEGEPPIVDGYIDTFNSGCGGMGLPFSELCTEGPPWDHLEFCGKSGWYDDGYRDTDWFIVTFNEGGIGSIDWWIDAEAGTYLFELLPLDCANVAVAQSVQVMEGCNPVTMTTYGAPGDPAWMWIGPDDFYPPPGFVGQEYDYLLIADGVQPCSGIATEAATWSGVKELYR